ncbi:MAG: acyl-CoA dehydrogenase N-terminal domain-containing protein, partial [Acidimicrobiia bacterium]
MSHYKSNLRDIEFNLFEFSRIHEYAGQWSELDRDTI